MVKKILFISLVLFIGLTLAGCMKSDFQKNIEAGDASLKERKYEEAIQYYKKAKEEEPEKEGTNNKILSAEHQYFDYLYEEGMKAKRTGQFTVAIELLERAYEINPTKKENLLDEKNKVKDLVVRQKELDDYMEWWADSSVSVLELRSSWRTTSDKISLGTMDAKQLHKKATEMLSKSNENVSAAEEVSTQIGGRLAEVHNTYLDNLQAIHNQIRKLIMDSQKPEFDVTSALSMGVGLNDIRSQQTNHIKHLETYAINNGIVFKEK